MKRLMLLTITACILISSSGCLTGKPLSGKSSIDVTLNTRGIISVQNKRIPINKIGHSLRKMGAPSQATIIIAIPNGNYESEITTIAKQLRTNGYPKHMFKRPKKAKAYVAPKKKR